MIFAPMPTSTTLPSTTHIGSAGPDSGAPADGRAELSGLTLLRIEGPDAAAFLQGQLTNDVDALAPGHWQWTGYCSPKGRLLAIGRLQRNEQVFHLQVPVELRDDLLVRLRRFVLRSKVTLAVLPPHWHALALSGLAPVAAAAHELGAAASDQFAVAGASAVLVSVGTGRAHLYFDPEAMPRLQAIAAGLPVVTALGRWQGADLHAAIPWITIPTQDAFIPQMVDLDAMAGVSFAKGCYPGQEIVARSRYLGEVKRRLFLGRTDVAALPGSSLEAAGGPVGKVVSTAPADGGGFDLLAVIDTEAAAAGGIAVTGSDATVHHLRRARPTAADG